MDSKIFLGCCGSYCYTCPAYKQKSCKGCKIGYKTGERDLSKAKCKIKVCCIKKDFISCADCEEYQKCQIIQAFHNHKGYKYKKYKEAINFIQKNGYKKFFHIANKWQNQYGKYK